MPKKRSYKYVVVTPHGYSREYYADSESFASESPVLQKEGWAWEGFFVLPKLLDDGWVPVREIPFAAETDGTFSRTSTASHILILLERDEPF